MPLLADMPSSGTPLSAISLSAEVNHGPFPSSITDALASPDADALRDLQSFINDLFRFPLGGTFYCALGVGAIILWIMVILGTIVIAHRTWQGKFWLVRYKRREHGGFLVPNALNAFTLFEGSFGISSIALYFVTFFCYHGEVDSLQKHIDAFNILVWIPLYLGALYASIGSFFAAPGFLDGGRVEKQWFFHRLFRKPWVINSITLGTPCALVAAVVPCAVLAQSTLNKAFRQYTAFVQDIDVAVAASTTLPITAPQAQDLLIEASGVWDTAANSKRYLSIGYAIWTGFAGMLLLFYIPAGGYMLHLLHVQVKKQHKLVAKLGEQQWEMLQAANQPVTHTPALNIQEATDSIVQDQEVVQPSGTLTDAPAHNIEEAADSILQETARPSGTLTAVSDVDEATGKPRRSLRVGHGGAMNVCGDSPPVSPRTLVGSIERYMSREKRKSRGTLGSREFHGPAIGTRRPDGEAPDVFFPPLTPKQRRREQEQLCRDARPYVRWKYLRRCYRSLCIFFGCIILAATVYLVVAARLAASFYSDMLQGPGPTAYLIKTSYLVTVWGAVLFGSLTLGAAFFRFFDPANNQERPSGSTPANFSNQQIAEQERGDSGGPAWDAAQSRTLPPLPETVPDTTTPLESQHLDHGDSAHVPVTGNQEMKFSLGRDAQRPDALIMMPVTSPTASFASPDAQTRPERSWRPFPHRWRSNGPSSRGAATGVPEDVTQASSAFTDELVSRPERPGPAMPRVVQLNNQHPTPAAIHPRSRAASQTHISITVPDSGVASRNASRETFESGAEPQVERGESCLAHDDPRRSPVLVAASSSPANTRRSLPQAAENGERPTSWLDAVLEAQRSISATMSERVQASSASTQTQCAAGGEPSSQDAAKEAHLGSQLPCPPEGTQPMETSSSSPTLPVASEAREAAGSVRQPRARRGSNPYPVPVEGSLPAAPSSPRSPRTAAAATNPGMGPVQTHRRGPSYDFF